MRSGQWEIVRAATSGMEAGCWWNLKKQQPNFQIAVDTLITLISLIATRCALSVLLQSKPCPFPRVRLSIPILEFHPQLTQKVLQLFQINQAAKHLHLRRASFEAQFLPANVMEAAAAFVPTIVHSPTAPWNSSTAFSSTRMAMNGCKISCRLFLWQVTGLGLLARAARSCDKPFSYSRHRRMCQLEHSKSDIISNWLDEVATRGNIGYWTFLNAIQVRSSSMAHGQGPHWVHMLAGIGRTSLSGTLTFIFWTCQDGRQMCCLHQGLKQKEFCISTNQKNSNAGQY